MSQEMLTVKRSGRAVPYDMISNLPNNALETILMCLPTLDAVRTSVLSKRWRYCWAQLPQLILDETLWNELKFPCHIYFTKILCHFLMIHQGPIMKFTLHTTDIYIGPDIDKLISFLSRNGIEDISLEMHKDYKLPSSFFTCKQLRHLTLRSFLIDISSLRGFSMLITLKLCNVNISTNMLGRLISNCPLLEILDLEICYYHVLEIDAPSLKTFSFKGRAYSIIFKNSPLLASATIVLLAPLLWCLPVLAKLEKLELGNYSLMSLGADNSSTLPNLTTLVYLKDLKLYDLELHQSNKQLLFVLSLIQKSPRLKFLDIVLSNKRADESLGQLISECLIGSELKFGLKYNELKEVKLENVTGKYIELQLIKLLLVKSPRLEKMLIRLGEVTVCKGYEILKEVTNYRRVSKQAEIVYEDKLVKQV